MKPTALALVLLVAPALAEALRALALAGDLETARVITVVAPIPREIDLAACDLDERAFAPQTSVDSTCLRGSAPATMTQT